MQKNSVTFGRVVFELYEWTDRQTDRHSLLMAILCIPPRGEVTAASIPTDVCSAMKKPARPTHGELDTGDEVCHAKLPCFRCKQVRSNVTWSPFGQSADVAASQCVVIREYGATAVDEDNSNQPY